MLAAIGMGRVWKTTTGSKALTCNALARIIKSFSETDFTSHPGQEGFRGTDPTVKMGTLAIYCVALSRLTL